MPTSIWIFPMVCVLRFWPFPFRNLVRLHGKLLFEKWFLSQMYTHIFNWQLKLSQMLIKFTKNCIPSLVLPILIKKKKEFKKEMNLSICNQNHIPISLSIIMFFGWRYEKLLSESLLIDPFDSDMHWILNKTHFFAYLSAERFVFPYFLILTTLSL